MLRRPFASAYEHYSSDSPMQLALPHVHLLCFSCYCLTSTSMRQRTLPAPVLHPPLPPHSSSRNMALMVDEVVMATASLLTVMVTAVVTMTMTVLLSESPSSMNNSMIQHAKSLSVSIRVLNTWVHMLYSIVAFVVLLLWCMGVSLAQARAWLHKHGLAVKPWLTKLMMSATSFMLVVTGAALRRELAEVKSQLAGTEREMAEHRQHTLKLEESLSHCEQECKTTLEGVKKELAAVKSELAGSKMEVAVYRECVSKLEKSLEQCGEGSKQTWEAILLAWSKDSPFRTTLELKNLSSISDTALHYASAMPCLTLIDLDKSSGFTAEGMKHIFKLSQLQRLSLRTMAVSDEYLEGIGAVKSLQHLSLTNSKVTDAGLQNLTGLSLKTLELNACQGITAAGMAHVGRLTSLESLLWGDVNTGGDGLQHLSSLINLKLHVLPPGITDSAMEHVRHLTALQHLDMTASAVTEDGVKWLKSLPLLSYVRTDQEDLQKRLKAALPRVTVSSDLLPGTCVVV
ncbi:unnamed protein product [Closterium sp. Yama58-4]|nr:unnamed protein product [Closterium sp. Yama58-4]